MQQPPNNPYANAAGAYDKNAKAHTGNQRELEARILLKANKMLQDLQNDWEVACKNGDIIEETLRYNRNIWMIFYDTALENPESDRPNELRSNIINLANFIFKRTIEIMADKNKDKKKLDALININKNIAAGLMTSINNSQNEEIMKNKTGDMNKNITA